MDWIVRIIFAIFGAALILFIALASYRAWIAGYWLPVVIFLVMVAVISWWLAD